MGEENKHQWAGYWIGLDILERLSDGGTGLTSAEVAAILGARSVRASDKRCRERGTRCPRQASGLTKQYVDAS